MLALRRFNNKLVLGSQTSDKTGANVVYELKEQKPVMLKIPREISGYLQLAPGAKKQVPMPFGYDRTTEKLYCIFRIKGIAGFSIITGNQASNILIKGTSAQVGRYSICDFFTNIAVYNPSDTATAAMQYTMFVVPDLADENNYYGLVSPLTTPSDSGGTPSMSSSCCARIYAGSGRLDYLITPVTTGAWQQVIGSVSASVTHIDIFDSSGETMELGVGGSGSETRVAIIPPGGISVDLVIPLGERISVRAISATANVGEIDISAYS